MAFCGCSALSALRRVASLSFLHSTWMVMAEEARFLKDRAWPPLCPEPVPLHMLYARCFKMSLLLSWWLPSSPRRGSHSTSPFSLCSLRLYGATVIKISERSPFSIAALRREPSAFYTSILSAIFAQGAHFSTLPVAGMGSIC